MTHILRQYCCLLIVVVSLAFSDAAIAEDIRIALRAHKGAQKGLEQWQATADYLTEKIPGHRFIMVPFDNISAMNQAISRGEFHFCLANPASAIEYRIRYNTQPIATLVNKRQGQGYSIYGAVIFTRADRKDINELKDLKGKTFIAVDEFAFGGWRIAWRELLKNNINPYADFKIMRFAGGKQQNVVFAVRDGSADAGSVRTDMLERLAASGSINLDDFKIIGNKKTEGFPFLHSTDLYPEWMFSAVRKMDDKLKTQVADALFSIPSDGLAAKKGKYVGWISPLDYTPVENLLKELRVGPYHVATMGSFERLVIQYGLVLFIVIIVVVLLTLTILYMVRLNRRITFAQDAFRNEARRRETLERQLMQAQKMEAIGHLTGGIAHDFNNMLASILGFTELAQELEVKDETGRLLNYLGEIEKAGERASTLVSQMLVYSRGDTANNSLQPIDLTSLLKESVKMLRPMLPSSIKMTVDVAGELPQVMANSVNLQQVIMNLCVNARDAMEGQGHIVMGLKVVRGFHGTCTSCLKDVPGDFVEFSISDTGSGIDEQHLQHIFEPFYTTKEVGKGTGMGLAVVHGIIHEHGGHIIVTSEKRKGTEFRLLLPITEHGVQQESRSKETETV